MHAKRPELSRMRQHHPFGAAGRPRRIENLRSARVRAPRSEGGGATLKESVETVRSLALYPDALQFLRQEGLARAIDDAEPRSAILEDEAHRVRGQPVVDRHRHR